MTLEHGTWRLARALAIVDFIAIVAGSGGCLGEVGSEGPAATDETQQAALDNREVPDGTACYQDVPMRKGTMSYGVCCFDDTEKGTSECVICDAAHHCTPGGATPGCLTGLCSAAFGSLQVSVSTGGDLVWPTVAPVARTGLAR
jgi:hypothetical protein